MVLAGGRGGELGAIAMPKGETRVVLLDWRCPRWMDEEVFAAIFVRRQATPVLMLTARVKRLIG